MHGQKALNSLDFENDFLLHHHICPESTVQCHPLVRYRAGYLALKGQALESQFMAQGLLVNGFQKSRTERPVHLNGRPEDSLS